MARQGEMQKSTAEHTTRRMSSQQKSVSGSSLLSQEQESEATMSTGLPKLNITLPSLMNLDFCYDV